MLFVEDKDDVDLPEAGTMLGLGTSKNYFFSCSKFPVSSSNRQMADKTRPSKRRRLSASAERVGETSTSREQPSRTDEKLPQADGSEEDGGRGEQRLSLFVRSLAPETTTENLVEHFSQTYAIKHAVAVLDKVKKTCKGYGFVTFTDAEDARQACEEFNGSELLGRKIKVEVAESRHREEDGVKTQTAGQSKRGQVQETRAPPRLIVRNLPWSIQEPEQLANLFRSYGKIKHVTIPKKGNKMIGFGVVLIRGHKNAEKAIAGVNGKEVDGRTLAVDWAVDRDTWQQMKKTEPQPDEEDDADGQTGEEEESGSEASEDDEENDSDEDMSDVGADDSEDDHESMEEPKNDNESTLFIRNLPFSCTDEDLYSHFRQFGPLRYARVVYDQNTEQPRGTGFVCFVSPDTCAACLRGAPKRDRNEPKRVQGNPSVAGSSVLQDEFTDPSGKYTLEGRVLQVSQAVTRSKAAQLMAEGKDLRTGSDKDKRHLYLLSEGTIPRNSELYQKLASSELAMREASEKQRKSLIQSNPSLHLSLTRLAIRNIPRVVTSRDLKTLAREAVVGFATDVEAGIRQPLSKEERLRGYDEMKAADHERRLKQKGIVKQAKVVFEGREGGKVHESDGVGRSRGYGFIEYYTHRSALMGLRWLNGHAVAKASDQSSRNNQSAEDAKDLKRRLIVEFAIENAQVVRRRQDRETKARSHDASDERKPTKASRGAKPPASENSPRGKAKRKRDQGESAEQETVSKTKDSKLAKRNRIISKKRMQRRTRKKAGSSA